MRRPFFILFLVLVAISIPASNIQAQDERWNDGCDPRVMNEIVGISDVIDYAGACDIYRTCDPRGDGDFLCQLRALQYMLEQCPANDMICTDGALLYSAVILMYDEPVGESTTWSPPPSIIEGVPQALRAYWEGDYQAALDAYNLTSAEDDPFNTMLFFSKAIIYQRLGETEHTLVEFEQATSSFFFDHPLTWYARSQFLGSLGRDEEASFDVLALSIYLANETDLATLVAPLESQFSAAKDQLEDWVLYPVSSTGGGVAGNFTSDLTLEEGRPVQIVIFPELNSIIGVGLQNWSSSSLAESTVRVQKLTLTDDNRYTLIYPSYWDNGGSISITIDENGIVSGSESIQYFEGSAQWRFMLAPVGANDPRETLSSETRYCSDSVRSRVNVGSRVRTVYYGTGISVGDAAGSIDGTSSPYEGIGPEEMVIIGGPECVEGSTWWEAISDDGTEGWIAEDVERTYYISPTTVDPSTFVCTDSPATQLSVGQIGRVIPGSGANNMRQMPSVESEVLNAIPEDGTFEILGDPLCADNLTWWYVDYEGSTGWTVEGQGDVYWLETVSE